MDIKKDKKSGSIANKRECFILPTYNEEKNIRRTIEGILSNQELVPGYQFEFLVVDDNSTDCTQKVVQDFIQNYTNLHIITGEKRGLGDAYKRGFKHALNLFKPDLVFQMDSDGQHDPMLIPNFIEQIDAGHSLVIGSRFAEGVSTPDFSF